MDYVGIHASPDFIVVTTSIDVVSSASPKNGVLAIVAEQYVASSAAEYLIGAGATMNGVNLSTVLVTTYVAPEEIVTPTTGNRVAPEPAIRLNLAGGCSEIENIGPAGSKSSDPGRSIKPQAAQRSSERHFIL
jgi:hypothetical protein